MVVPRSCGSEVLHTSNVEENHELHPAYSPTLTYIHTLLTLWPIYTHITHTQSPVLLDMSQMHVERHDLDTCHQQDQAELQAAGQSLNYYHSHLQHTTLLSSNSPSFHTAAGKGVTCPQIHLLPPDSKGSWKKVGLCGICIFFGLGERIKWTQWWRGWWGNATNQNCWARTTAVCTVSARFHGRILRNVCSRSGMCGTSLPSAIDVKNIDLQIKNIKNVFFTFIKKQ